MKYTITIRPTGTVFAVRAASIEHAAAVAARKLYGRQTTVHRATGTAGLSGVFSAYQFDRRMNASNHVGSEYHVKEQAS